MLNVTTRSMDFSSTRKSAMRMRTSSADALLNFWIRCTPESLMADGVLSPRSFGMTLSESTVLDSAELSCARESKWNLEASMSKQVGKVDNIC